MTEINPNGVTVMEEITVEAAVDYLHTNQSFVLMLMCVGALPARFTNGVWMIPLEAVHQYAADHPAEGRRKHQVENFGRE